MNYSKFNVTVSCHKREPHTVGDRWFLAEYIATHSHRNQVAVVTKKEGKHFLDLRLVDENDRVELFPDVFVTFTDLSKRSKVKLCIEAPRGIPISRGYPYQRIG